MDELLQALRVIYPDASMQELEDRAKQTILDYHGDYQQAVAETKLRSRGLAGFRRLKDLLRPEVAREGLKDMFTPDKPALYDLNPEAFDSAAEERRQTAPLGNTFGAATAGRPLTAPDPNAPPPQHTIGAAPPEENYRMAIEAANRRAMEEMSGPRRYASRFGAGLMGPMADELLPDESPVVAMADPEGIPGVSMNAGDVLATGAGVLTTALGGREAGIRALRAIAPATKAGSGVRKMAWGHSRGQTVGREMSGEVLPALGYGGGAESLGEALEWGALPLALGGALGGVTARGAGLKRTLGQGAGIKLPDGQVLRGRRHAEIIAEHGIDEATLEKSTRGLFDTKGNFVPEDKAVELGKKSGQIRGLDAAQRSSDSALTDDTRSVPRRLAADFIEAMEENPAGATVSARLGNMAERSDLVGQKGTAVANQQVKAEIGDLAGEGTEEALEKFVQDNSHYLIDNPDRFALGGWVDKNGKLWVEVSEMTDRPSAIKTGTRMNQQAVADMDAMDRNAYLVERIPERAQEIAAGNRVTEFARDATKADDSYFKGFDNVDDLRYETPAGELQVAVEFSPYDNNLHVSWFGEPSTGGRFDELDLGDKAVMEIFNDVLKRYPEAETVTAQRITGMRAGSDDATSQFGQWLDKSLAPARRRGERLEARAHRQATSQATAEAEALQVEAFPGTGGTGDFISPIQVALRNFNIAGPGTTGATNVALGGAVGAVAGAAGSEGMSEDQQALNALAGAFGGAILGGMVNNLARTGGLQVNRPGYVLMPGVKKRGPRLTIDGDAFNAASREEVERVLNDPHSYGMLIHHRFGGANKPTGLTPVEGAPALSGSTKLDLTQFTHKMRERFPDMSDKDIKKHWQNSFDKYVEYVRDKVDAMESMADWETLLGYYQRGVAALDGAEPWYTGVRETVFSVLGPDMGEKFIRFLAAYSPQTSAVGEGLHQNIGLAKKGFLRWLKGEDAYSGRASRLNKDKRGGDVIPGRPKGNDVEFTARGANARVGYLDSTVGDAVDATGEPFFAGKTARSGTRQVFNGRKLDNYYRALMGDPDAVVADMWMARLFGFPDGKVPNEASYSFIEQAVRQMAHEMGVTPVEVQAALWMGIKNHWMDLGRSPREITENYAITLRNSLKNDPGFVDLAMSRWDTPGAIAAAKRLKESLPKGDPTQIVEAGLKLGNQLGFADKDILRAIARTGAAGMVGGAIGGQVDDDGNPIQGALVGAAAGALGVNAFNVKAARQAWKGMRTQSAQATQAWEEAVAHAKNPRAAVHGADAPTSGFHVTDPVDINEFFGSLDRLMLHTDTEQFLGSMIERTVRNRGLPDQAQRSVTVAETRKAAATLGLDMSNLNPRRMNQVEMEAVLNHITEATEKLDQTVRLLSDRTRPVEEIERLTRVHDALDQRLGDLLETFNTARSQFGRNLNILRWHAHRTTSPTFWYAKAQKMADGPFTAEHRAAIDGFLREGDTDGLVQYISQLKRYSLPEKLSTIWKAGLLTAPTTHAANAIGNVSMMMLEGAKDVPGVLADRLMSIATGQVTKGSAFAGVRSLPKGTSKGLKGVAKTAKSGITPSDLYGKYDLNFGEVHFGTPGLVGIDQWKKEPAQAFLNLYTKSIFRGLLAGDAFFRAQALERSMVDLAEAYATNAGLKGKAFKARVKELLVNPTDEMQVNAIHDAEVATFVNQPRIGEIASGLTRGINNAPASLGVAGDFVVPFKRTPLNVIERAFEYSPLGGLARGADIAKLYKLTIKKALSEKGLTDAEEILMFKAQRAIANTLGRSATGSGTAVFLGYQLGNMGLMTGAYPDDERTRNEWELEGKTANSVRIGKNWYSLDRISPLGNLMVFGAAMSQAAQEMQGEKKSAIDYMKIGASGAVGGVQSLLNQTFLTNVSQYMEAALGKGNMAANTTTRLANQFAGSLVPSVIRRYSHSQDPVLREVENPADAFFNNLPGGAEARGIPGKQDNLGRIRERTARGWEYLLNPIPRSADKTQTDEVVKFLDKLNVVPGDRRPIEGLETPEGFRKRLAAEGEAITAAVHQLRGNATVTIRYDDGSEVQKPFNDATPEEQRGVMEKVITEIRTTITKTTKDWYASQASR